MFLKSGGGVFPYEATFDIGSEGLAQVVIDLRRCLHLEIKGVVLRSKQETASEIAGVSVLGDDRVLKEFPSSEVELVNGVGSIKVGQNRK